MRNSPNTLARSCSSLPANLKPGEYTSTINGAGQVPRDYQARRDPKAPCDNKVRAIFPSNPITIRVAAPASKNL